MNATTIRRTAAWSLAALLTLIAGLGEGLHWLPGMGHGLLVGDRVLLLGETPRDPLGGLGSRACCTGVPSDDSLPVLDEDDCPICQILGLSFESGAPAALPAVDLLAAYSRAAPAPALPLAPAVYQPRGPPLAAAYASLV